MESHTLDYAPLNLDTIYESFTPQSSRRPLIGPELERLLLNRDGHPVAYHGSRGVGELFQYLESKGWKLLRESGMPYAACLDGETISLEPGCQLEHSLAPKATVNEIFAQAKRISQLIQDCALDWSYQAGQPAFYHVSLGYTPVAPEESLPWAPRQRYRTMYEQLVQVNPTERAMMQGTCALQCRYDYRDESDCMAMVHVAVRLSPLLMAMFANSPFYQGRPASLLSMRGYFRTRTDPVRGRFPSKLLPFSFHGWIEHLLDLPVLLVKQEGRMVHGGGRTFRSWVTKGGFGRLPTWEDWQLHQSQFFPEVRIDRQVELRMTDMVPMPVSMAFCALFRGLFYCPRALEQAFAFAERFDTAGDATVCSQASIESGLETVHGGRRLSSWAQELHSIVDGYMKETMHEDHHWLSYLPIQTCPARQLVEAWKRYPSVETIMVWEDQLEDLTEVRGKPAKPCASR